MLLGLAGVLWLTIAGANAPSEWLARALGWVQAQFSALLTALHAPLWLQGLLVDGMFRTLAWVVAVMLPPMAIFFPLFTLLEDAGYLPRVAYNLDRPFHACHACGKQALTMCMGLGCNAAGVVGCRIIDSERERLLAVQQCIGKGWICLLSDGRVSVVADTGSGLFDGTGSGAEALRKEYTGALMQARRVMDALQLPGAQ